MLYTGMATYTLPSAHPEIGTYYSHNGGDGNDQGSGGGAWFEADGIVIVMLNNSPCKAPYGIDGDGNDQSAGYLFTAMDNALAAAIS